tara:strand:+ start:678 stop:1007 length:330 start_codon:yes stop_codon:yes gene_type:complete
MITIAAITKQKNPAKATVVNLGVSFLHLKDTEKTENPSEQMIPNTNPTIEFSPVFPNAMMSIPTAAITIETQTFIEICSFKKTKAKSAVKKGIAARHNNVIAADVFVIE